MEIKVGVVMAFSVVHFPLPMPFKTLLIASSLAAISLIWSAAPGQPQIPAAEASRSEHIQALVNELELSQEQQAQLQQVWNNAFEELHGILTPEQHQAYDDAFTSGQNPHSALSNVNLTETQRHEMRTVLHTSWQQTHTILTPQQQQQLEAIREARSIDRIRQP